MKFVHDIDHQGVRTFALVTAHWALCLLIAHDDGRWRQRWVDMPRFGARRGRRYHRRMGWLKIGTIWMPWLMFGLWRCPRTLIV